MRCHFLNVRRFIAHGGYLHPARYAGFHTEKINDTEQVLSHFSKRIPPLNNGHSKALFFKSFLGSLEGAGLGQGEGKEGLGLYRDGLVYLG